MDTATVGGNGFITGNIKATKPSSVTGTLQLPISSTITGPVTSGALVREPVVVPPGCDCSATEKLPIAAIVAAHATANDNAAIGLDPNILAGPTPPAKPRIDLPCGHFYFSKIVNSNPVTIAVHGNAAIYIGGEVTNGGEIAFVLDPTATLDVLIGGGLCNSAPLTLGSPNYPAQMRVYVAGTNACAQPDTSVRISSPGNFAAYLYAPYGGYTSSAKIRHYGGVFAGSATFGSETEIHYDRAVLKVAEKCPPPPGMGDAGVDSGKPGCGTCRDCDNGPCVAGECTDKCTNSSQCCPPLECIGGGCRVAIK